MADVTIVVDGAEQTCSAGLISAASLYAAAGPGCTGLRWKRADGTEIPLSPTDRMQIRGGEVFVSGAPAEEDNPQLSEAFSPEFNGRRELQLLQAKISGRALRENDEEFPQGRLFLVLEKEELDAEIEDDVVVVVREEDAYLVIPRGDDDAVDVEECGRHGRRVPRHRQYRIRIDREKRIVEVRKITGRQILELVGKSYHEWALNRKLPDARRVRVEPDETVDLAEPGVERFETVRRQAQQGSGA